MSAGAHVTSFLSARRLPPNWINAMFDVFDVYGWRPSWQLEQLETLTMRVSKGAFETPRTRSDTAFRML
jgi:hypothetical protein